MTEVGLKASCVIPAWNEGARIGAVLAALAGHPALAEVIVVDDGSTDDTVAVARAAGARVITMAQNGGKTAALAEGIRAATAPLLLLLDADLRGLSPQDVTDLVAPVATGRADVSISLRGNAPRLWQLLGLDYISGERVLPRAMLEGGLDILRHLPGFGFEVHLNTLWIGERARIAVVRWPGVESPLKAEKQGWARGIASDIGMLRDIFRTVTLRAVISQILSMRALRVR